MKTKTRLAGALLALSVGTTWLLVSGGATGAPPRSSQHLVSVFFTRESALQKDCSGTKAFDRVTYGRDYLHDALNWLLKGPRASEERAGVDSLFSGRTAGMLNSVRIEGGVAFVDFDDFRRKIRGASSSCGSAVLLTELNRTSKQFPSVDRAVYSFEGNVRAFYNWIQRDPPAH